MKPFSQVEPAEILTQFLYKGFQMRFVSRGSSVQPRCFHTPVALSTCADGTAAILGKACDTSPEKSTEGKVGLHKLS